MPINLDRILFEDDHLLAVNKLSGELTVKGKGKIQKLPLLDFLKQDYPSLQTIHRLDFETSGVVVFAKGKQVASVIKESAMQGWVKTYQALIKGWPHNKGAIKKPLPAREKGMVPAETQYRVCKNFGDVSLIECTITTGRHHQIRKHFAGIGFPLVLDEVYGDKQFNRMFGRQFRYKKFFLHAYSVSFLHPVTNEKVFIKADLPKVFEVLLKKL
jgi:23S rRNA pseudouridine955/2504/2580 synthase